MSNDANIRFYHGLVSREDAEQLLKGTGGEGTFLVRNSSTSVGDYVLSVLVKDEVIHYQIRKHENDAFFSIDEQVICHGLETLIEYHQNIGGGIISLLGSPIIKDSPPPDTRRHGRTNLLHRATKEGDVKIVEELLKCGYRSLEAKNQHGQTALHLACQLSEDSILQKLIASGANVNCRDTEGNTPLHYACHRNSVDNIRTLIEKGGALVQMRNTNTNWVALHEAASRGCVDSVITLLSLGAPLRPRTSNNELPIDLARANGHQKCVEVLANHLISSPKTSKSEWYHGTLGRGQAVEILARQSGNSDGSFLVRFSKNTGLVLTMLYSEQGYHFPIQKEQNFYFIDDGPYLESLELLVEHYMTLVDGLPSKLLVPIAPEPNPPLPSSPHPTTLQRSTRKDSQKLCPSDVNDLGSLNIQNANTLPKLINPKQTSTIFGNELDHVIERPNLSKTDGFIPSDNIILREIIGEGEFGSVHRGILQNRQGFEEEVAVKMVRIDIAAPNKEEFFREANVMMKLNHECIVKFIGISTENNLLMVQELVALGSMLGYLLKFPNQVSPMYELKLWAWQIARGMQYLEEHRFVHRDLAGRNILLATKYQAKITDFGLSRTLSSNQEYYRASTGGRWPIKWYAPESFNYGTFSSASDVWSFGILLWEMYSYGQQPYGSLRGNEVIDLVEKGERLPQPSRCSKEIYDIMYECWAYNSCNRPSFSELALKFTCPDYSNIQELRMSNNNT